MATCPMNDDDDTSLPYSTLGIAKNLAHHGSACLPGRATAREEILLVLHPPLLNWHPRFHRPVNLNVRICSLSHERARRHPFPWCIKRAVWRTRNTNADTNASASNNASATSSSDAVARYHVPLVVESIRAATVTEYFNADTAPPQSTQSQVPGYYHRLQELIILTKYELRVRRGSRCNATVTGYSFSFGH
ncbi:hypothetical protein CKAH01_06736 [Colletotrichum kahawae]|uniref:Uncharacterized protein n=1 Tax=Colletotrichum kahawae TaxID=34407 RepID=A0AAD9Y9N0_COLKA|nr:hypothetical protein CKAH01_06736 [Colletotrichum kahawae]